MSSSWMIDVPNLFMPGVLALIVIAIAKRFDKLSVTAKKWWLFAHVLAVAVYFAGTFGTGLLTVLARPSGDNALIYSAAQFVPTFDHFLIIPGALISLITGLVLSVRTNWGLTNYYWVICKWVGNIAIIMFGATVQRHFMDNLAAAATRQAGALQSPAFLNARGLMFLGVGLVLAGMIFLTAISYLKPFGKRA